MWRQVATLAALLAVTATGGGSAVFSRTGCGCLRSPHAARLTAAELATVRTFLSGPLGLDAGVFNDNALQALFQFQLLNNAPSVLPTTRDGFIQLFLGSLRGLNNRIVPSQADVATIIAQLSGQVQGLGTAGLDLGVTGIVPASAVVLFQRGVSVNTNLLQLALQNSLTGFLQSRVLQATFDAVSQSIAFLDNLDLTVPEILKLTPFVEIRNQLGRRFDLDGDIFDARFRLSVREFERSRARILSTFDLLAVRGPGFESSLQIAIRALDGLFPGITVGTARSLINILLATNFAGGQGSPEDVVALITLPELTASIRVIDDVSVQRLLLQIASGVSLTAAQLREAYSLYIIGLMSQGIQPLNQEAALAQFLVSLQRFFLASQTYSPDAFFTYVIRVVVTQIPRGSANFGVFIFEPRQVVGSVLVPRPLVKIFREGRKTVIPRIFGPQGNSQILTRRITVGEGAKPAVENIVKITPIVSGPVPRRGDLIGFGGLDFTETQIQVLLSAISGRFGSLTDRALVEPLVQLLLESRVITGGDPDSVVATITQLIQGLPDFQQPDDLARLLGQVNALTGGVTTLSEAQLLAGLQQFFITTRLLGVTIPAQTFPNIFLTSLQRFILTLPKFPLRPFDIAFLRYIRGRLPDIIRSLLVVRQSIPLLNPELDEIFAVLGPLRISPRARRIIIRFIDASNLPRAPAETPGQVVGVFRSLLQKLRGDVPQQIFLLQPDLLEVLRTNLLAQGITVGLQELRDLNAMAVIGLQLFDRLDDSITPAALQSILQRTIVSFSRTNNVANIITPAFFRILLSSLRSPPPEIPVIPDTTPVIVQPPPPPMAILDSLTLTSGQLSQLVAALQRLFPFVTIDNIVPILIQIILIRRAASVDITQANLLDQLTTFVGELPDDIAIRGIDFDALRQEIDGGLDGVTITGNGVRTSLVELVLNLRRLGLGFPGASLLRPFGGFVVTRFGHEVTRQQLRFGVPFFNFLDKFLPSLPPMVTPFPIFSAPRIIRLLRGHTGGRPLVLDDLQLLIQAAIQAGGLSLDGLTVDGFIKAIQDLPEPSGDLFSALTSEELEEIVSQIKAAQLGGDVVISPALVRRAFRICHLVLRFRKPRILSRKSLIRGLSSLLIRVGRQHKRFLVPQLVPTFVTFARTGGLGFGRGGGRVRIKLPTLKPLRG